MIQDRLGLLRRLVVTACGVASVRIVGVLLQYGMNVYLARLLPTPELSSFWLCITIVTLFCWVAGAGLQAGAVRFLPGYLEDADYAHAHGFGRVVLYATVLGPLSVSLTATAILIPMELPWVDSGYLIASGALLVGSCLLGGLSETIRATHRPAVSMMIPSLVVPALTLLGVVALSGSYAVSATVLLTLSAAGAFVGCMIQLAILMRLPEIRQAIAVRPRFDGQLWLSRSAGLGVFALVWNLSQTVDFLVVGATLRPEDVAIYGAVLKVLAAQHLLSSTIMSAAGSHLSKAVVTRSAELNSEVGNIGIVLNAGMISIFVLFVVAGEQLLELFGPQFGSGHPVLCILSFGLVIRSAFGPCEALLMYSDHSRAIIVGSAVGTALTAMTSWIVAPLLGIGAVAIVSVVSFLAVYVYFYLRVRTSLGLDPSIFAAAISKLSVSRR